MIGLREIEATQRTIQELRDAGEAERAAAVAAVLEAATSVLAGRTGGTRPLMTTGEAARALGVSIQTIKNWGKAGRLTMVRLGGRNYVPREDLLALTESLRVRPRGDGPFDGPGVDDARLRAVLPDELTARIDRYHDAIERGETLDGESAADLARLHAAATELVVEHLEAVRPSRRR